MDNLNDQEIGIAEYLTRNEISFEFEPIQRSTSKRPDFEFGFAGCKVLLEAKQIHSDYGHKLRIEEDHSHSGNKKQSNINPYKPVRKKIDQARSKFQKIGGKVCGLVLSNPHFTDFRLTPHIIYGSMLGDAGIRQRFDANSGSLIASTEKFAWVGDNGKMLSSKTGPEGSNTSISAVLVLSRLDIPTKDFEDRLRGLAIKKTKTPFHLLPAKERAVIAAEVALASKRPIFNKPWRMQVYHNPIAKKPFPEDLFVDDYDEHWVANQNGYQLIVAGRLVEET